MSERLTAQERENTRALARAWLETSQTDPLHGIGLLLNSLLDERDAAVADLEKVTQERDEKHYIPQDLAREMRNTLLHFLWPGMEDTPPGVPNTFINLVQDVIDRAKKAEQRVNDLDVECEKSLRAAEVAQDIAERSVKMLADFAGQTPEEQETNLRRLNTTITNDELVELERLCEAASPGQISKPMSNGAIIDASGVLVMRIVYASDAIRERIVTAYNVLPRLLEMVRGRDQTLATFKYITAGAIDTYQAEIERLRRVAIAARKLLDQGYVGFAVDDLHCAVNDLSAADIGTKKADQEEILIPTHEHTARMKRPREALPRPPFQPCDDPACITCFHDVCIDPPDET